MTYNNIVMSLARPLSNFEPKARHCSFVDHPSAPIAPLDTKSRSESESDSFGSEEFETHVVIEGNTPVENLDALINNTGFETVHINPVQLNQEVLVKLYEVMKCNKSVESLSISIASGLLRERFFAALATSGGWSSIQQLFLFCDCEYHHEPLSLREAKHLSSFILQCENLRTLKLAMAGVETAPIVSRLYRTNIEVLILNIYFDDTFSLQNGGRQLATAFERCTCITELQLHIMDDDEVEVEDDVLEFFQILLVESIPKMLGLKKFELDIDPFDEQCDHQFFDMVGQCFELHQGEIEELTLDFGTVPSVNTSIFGLTPALESLKVIRFRGATLTSQHMGELLGIAADCDALEEFHYNLSHQSTDYFKAICQLLSKFPSLKRVTQEHVRRNEEVDLRKEGRLTAFLEMVKTSKTIEEVPSFRCGNDEEEAAISYHCHNNMIHSRIYEEGLLAANVPDSAWPLILEEFSDMPDVLYYLLHQKNGAMIGHSRHGRKRKQDSGD